MKKLNLDSQLSAAAQAAKPAAATTPIRVTTPGTHSAQAELSAPNTTTVGHKHAEAGEPQGKTKYAHVPAAQQAAAASATLGLHKRPYKVDDGSYAADETDLNLDPSNIEQDATDAGTTEVEDDQNLDSKYRR